MKNKTNVKQLAGVITLVLSLSGCPIGPKSPKSDDGNSNSPGNPPGHPEVRGKPILRTVTPNRGYQKGGAVIEISVGNIDSKSTVSVGDTECSPVDAHPKSELIFCTLPMHPSIGKVDLKVTNPNGESDQLTQAFEYEEDPEKVEKRLKDKEEELKQKIAAEERSLRQGLSSDEQKKQRELEALRNKHSAELTAEENRNRTEENNRYWRAYNREAEKRKLDAIKAQQAQVTAQLQATQAANQAERQRLAALQQNVVAMQNRVQTAEEEATRLEQERVRLQAALEANRVRYQTDLAAYTRDRAALDTQVAQDPVALSARERDRLQAERAELEARLQAIRTQTQENTTTAEEAQREVARLTEIRRQLDLNRLQREIEDAEASIIALQTRQEELNQNLDQARRAQFAAQRAAAEGQQEAQRRAQAERNAALLARIAAEEEAEAARNAQGVPVDAHPANAGAFAVQSPPNVVCNGPYQNFSADQLTHHRENLEDVERLIHASCSELGGLARSPHTVTDVGNHSAKLEEALRIGQAMQTHWPRLREGDASILYKGQRYQINSVFVSVADPYLFIEKQNHSLNGIPAVDDAELNRLNNRLVENARRVGGADAARIRVLEHMLSHMWILNGVSADVAARKQDMRKRLSRLISAIDAMGGTPQELDAQLGLLTNILEGDTATHCTDGLETQLIAAESAFLGLGNNMIKGFGDHISRTLRAYKSEFIQKHKTLYSPTSASFAEKEAYTYTPIGLNKMMLWSMGLMGSLAPLEWPKYFPPNNDFSRDHDHFLVNDDRKKGLVSERVFERLLAGGTINFAGGSVTFEALTPSKMIRLLDLTARRGLSAQSVARDPELRESRHGLKITPTFIQSQFHADQPGHPTAFMTQNAAFAGALNADYENLVVMMDESHYFKLLGNEIIPTEAFWTEMLIHYGYIVRVQ